jgi:hypothetical protein
MGLEQSKSPPRQMRNEIAAVSTARRMIAEHAAKISAGAV